MSQILEELVLEWSNINVTNIGGCNKRVEVINKRIDINDEIFILNDII